MGNPLSPVHEAIDSKFDELRQLIEQAVRAEQLRHQLTGLPNGLALAESAEREITDGSVFWLAFVEVDRFKQLNDRFGYEHADAMLREIAALLEQSSASYFAKQAVAFHAHGDEFYLLGRLAPIAFSVDEVHRKLDQIRAGIAQIALRMDNAAELMHCTVSVGWTISPGGRYRDYLHRVELAVASAKRAGRDRVLQYDEAMQKARSVSLRSDCSNPDCLSTYAFEVRLDARYREDVFCPNCGARGPRPAHAEIAGDLHDITDLPPS